MTVYPENIASEKQLEDLLSLPSPELIDLMGRLEGDIAVLGVAGKMGVTLAQSALRAARQAGAKKIVYGVSRFSDESAVEKLTAAGVSIIQCDLLDRNAVASLPRVGNVIYMAGRKFGTQTDHSLTWTINAVAPANAAEHYAQSRFVAFSTGCVYPLLDAALIGSTETDPLEAVGEYAQSCLARERVFEYYSRRNGTPVCLFRLNYALELRYGVIYDIATKIWNAERVELNVPYFNGIWQGDACDRALRALELAESPARPLNVTGPEKLAVREVAEKLAAIMKKDVRFAGEPGPTAYLNDAAQSMSLFGPPRVSVDQVIRWTADWIMRGGRSLSKPTHFEASNGKY